MTARKSYHLHKRLGDQLLTALTILLSVLLFVAAPLQANGVLSPPLFGLFFVDMKRLRIELMREVEDFLARHKMGTECEGAALGEILVVQKLVGCVRCHRDPKAQLFFTSSFSLHDRP